MSVCIGTSFRCTVSPPIHSSDWQEAISSKLFEILRWHQVRQAQALTAQKGVISLRLFFEKSSGNREFDDSVRRTILASQPFPELANRRITLS